MPFLQRSGITGKWAFLVSQWLIFERLSARRNLFSSLPKSIFVFSFSMCLLVYYASLYACLFDHCVSQMCKDNTICLSNTHWMFFAVQWWLLLAKRKIVEMKCSMSFPFNFEMTAMVSNLLSTEGNYFWSDDGRKQSAFVSITMACCKKRLSVSLSMPGYLFLRNPSHDKAAWSINIFGKSIEISLAIEIIDDKMCSGIRMG